MHIVAIDFEASCLPVHGRSYPIEVGISGDGRTSRSWLIRPHPIWKDWDWTEEAEALHGIAREQLFSEGMPPEIVLNELGRCIKGKRVIADSYLDRDWMAVLASAAQASPPVQIGHVEEIIDSVGATDRQLRELAVSTDRRPGRRHRAGEDARRLFALIEALQTLPAEHAADQGSRPLFAW